MGSTLSGGRGDPDRPGERFTGFSVLPAMDRKQKQAQKVQYAQAAVISTFLFLPVPLFFYASVVPPSVVFLIPSPNLSLTALSRSHKDPNAQNRPLSPCRFSSFFSVLNCWEEVWEQIFSHCFGSQRECCSQWLCILRTMQSPESSRSV